MCGAVRHDGNMPGKCWKGKRGDVNGSDSGEKGELPTSRKGGTRRRTREWWTQEWVIEFQSPSLETTCQGTYEMSGETSRLGVEVDAKTAG